MSDNRITAPNGKFTTHMISAPVINVYDGNDKTATQFIYGEIINVYDGNIAQSHWDKYVGTIRGGYSNIIVPTHFIAVASSPVFIDANLKSKHICNLSLNSRVAVTETSGKFSKTSIGWIYTSHILDINLRINNASPVDLAMAFLGTPYIWGGKSSVGIDCSGLVQMVYKACGVELPRDTDMQESMNYASISKSELQKNDLVFWQGHIGIMVDGNRLLHANATNMCVSLDNLDNVSEIILKNNGGDITKMIRVL